MKATLGAHQLLVDDGSGCNNGGLRLAEQRRLRELHRSWGLRQRLLALHRRLFGRTGDLAVRRGAELSVRGPSWGAVDEQSRAAVERRVQVQRWPPEPARALHLHNRPHRVHDQDQQRHREQNHVEGGKRDRRLRRPTRVPAPEQPVARAAAKLSRQRNERRQPKHEQQRLRDHHRPRHEEPAGEKTRKEHRYQVNQRHHRHRHAVVGGRLPGEVVLRRRGQPQRYDRENKLHNTDHARHQQRSCPPYRSRQLSHLLLSLRHRHTLEYQLTAGSRSQTLDQISETDIHERQISRQQPPNPPLYIRFPWRTPRRLPLKTQPPRLRPAQGPATGATIRAE